jgi:hypothetical protein
VLIQRGHLEKIKTYLEHGTTKGSTAEDEPLQRVKYSFTTAPSTFVKRRKQVTLYLETIIAANRRDVFDTVVTRVDRFWEWMVDRSDPSGQLDISPDWPKPGSQYQYRKRSKLPFNTWETGTISIIECTSPEHALMREEQNLRIYKALMSIDWKFEEVETGTRLTVQYDIVFYNYFINRSFINDFETTARWLQKQVTNIIRVCEKR